MLYPINFKRVLFFVFLLVLSCGGGGGPGTENFAPGTPLAVDPANPRYFMDRSGRAVYLTGSHTWANLKDRGTTDPPPPFDFDAYLAFLKKNNHNFIRLWTLEETNYADPEKDKHFYMSPSAWARSGPGLALDGKPKFNLEVFNEAYFTRLRSRVAAARANGIFVSVMLFDGWNALNTGRDKSKWKGNPFNAENNVNGIDGDPDKSGIGHETNTLSVPAITRIQEAYVKKVIDTVGDLENVLWEIANEGHAGSVEWQYHFIDFVKGYERTKKPLRHPVGLTFIEPHGDNSELFESNADWISPGARTYYTNPEEPYKVDPPEADGGKVIILDTDHLWGVGGDHKWVWKSFLRGYNPIFMDPYEEEYDYESGEKEEFDVVRKSMGQTLSYANRVDLRNMLPAGRLASTKYCLAKAGSEYLVYLPERGSVSMNLGDAEGEFTIEWFSPVEGSTVNGEPVQGGGEVKLVSPFEGDAVVYLRKN